MLTKVLLTLLVIVGCVLLMRAKRNAAQPVAQTVTRTAKRSPWLWISGGVMALVVFAGALLWVFDWQDSRVLLEVNVIDPVNEQTQTYRAYRSALQGRQFTTVDGLEVRLGESERVEVRELGGQ